MSAARPRHRVEAGREHDGVELVLAICGANSGRRHRLDRARAQVDQLDVVAVERLVVVRVEAHPLGADGIGLAGQRQRDPGIVDDSAHLVAQELGERVVGALLDHEVVEAADDVVAADRPARLVALETQRFGCGRGRFVMIDPQRPVSTEPSLGPQRRIVLLHGGDLAGIQRRVSRRHREVRRPLEHHQRLGLLCEQGDDLYPGRAGADDANPLTGEVHSVRWPIAGVQRAS